MSDVADSLVRAMDGEVWADVRKFDQRLSQILSEDLKKVWSSCRQEVQDAFTTVDDYY